MRITRARANDAARLTRIAFAAKRSWGHPDDWIRQWAGTLTVTPAYIRRHRTYCARLGHSTVAFCALRPDGTLATVDHFWVAPEHVGRGIGRALFRHGEAMARRAGAKTMNIESDPHAAGFYRRMGARTVGRRPAPMGGVQRYLPQLVKALSRTAPGRTEAGGPRPQPKYSAATPQRRFRRE